MSLFLQRLKVMGALIFSMKVLLPQELDVWYMVPFIRRHLAHILKNELGQTQKDIAGYLGITEAAVSQYMHTSRGDELVVSEAARAELMLAADELRSGKSFLHVMNRLLRTQPLIKIKCALHRKKDKAIPEDCRLCLD